MKPSLPSIAAFLALASGSAASAQSIELIILSKLRWFSQTSATNVVQSAQGPYTNPPYEFACSVGGTDVAGLNPPPRVTGPFASPINNGVMGLVPGQQEEWQYGPPLFANFADTQAALDAAFPNGTYSIRVQGVNVPLLLSGNLYAGLAPVMTITGGAWSPAGTYKVREHKPLTITTSPFTEYGSGLLDVIIIEAFGNGVFVATEQYSSDSPSNSATLKIPPNTFVGRTTQRIDALFIRCVEVKDGIPALPDAFATSFYEVATRVVLDVLPRADLNGDGAVLGADLGVLLSSWGACAGCDADLDGSGEVDAADLAIMLADWG